MIYREVSIVIPTYKPDNDLGQLLDRLSKQDYRIKEIIIINTDEIYFDESILDGLDAEFEDKLQIVHIKKSEYDHGGTRNFGMNMASGELVMFMTQDAMPKDRHLVSTLVSAFETDGVYVSYARQLPKKSCHIVEQYTREFNYPYEDIIKDASTLETYGIKNYFCSDVCSMYRKDKFVELGGFPNHIIFNEDMIYAHKAIENGGKIYYASWARVVHSHNYTCMQQLRRNFDNGVSQSMHPEVFEGIKSEGEGIRMIRDTARKLIDNGYWYELPGLIVKSGFKFIGFRLGKNYKSLSESRIKSLTSNIEFWNSMEEK